MNYLLIALCAALLALYALEWVDNAGTRRELYEAREAWSQERQELEAAGRAAAEHALAAERESRARIANLQADYTEALHDATAQHDADLAGLRAGTLRLRHQLTEAQHATCADAVRDPGAVAAGGDPVAILRTADAAAAVQLGRAADAEVRHLQSLIAEAWRSCGVPS